LGTEFSADYLFEKAKKHRCNIKTFIMNQKIVVGVGNIYANESLFFANIHPLQQANTISYQQYQTLTVAIQNVLTAAIEKGGTTLKDFRQSDGKPGYFSQELTVYDRDNLPCIHCKTLISAMRIGQRSTYFCPKCQKLPRQLKK
jgi:formamidopyrimidine-DNA glycosylase